MQRFVSMRSSSSVDLDSSSLDDVRTERAAIALSVGLSWPPFKRRRSAGRPSWQQLWERALQEHILHHHELPHGVRLQWPDWWALPLAHEEIADVKLLVPLPPSTPAAALVEESSGSTAKRRKVQVDPIVRDWFLDMLDQWKTERRWGIQRCLCEVQRVFPAMFDRINHSTPYRWKRSSPRAAALGRKTLLSPADTAERAHPASDRRPVPQRCDDQEPGARMARRRGTRRLLRGMRLRHKKPARCVKELHSPEQQQPTHTGSSSSCAG